MARSAATLLLAASAACASDVDLQLGIEADGNDAGISSSIGALRSSRVFTGPGYARVMGVAWLSSSVAVVGGNFDGAADFGAGPVDGLDYSMGFVAAYDAATGNPSWVHAFSGSTATDVSYQLTTSNIEDVAVASDGTVYAVGSFGRTIDFGTGPVESTDGCHDGVVARYAADGTPLLPLVLPRSPLHAVAAMPDGGLVTAGYEVLSDCPWLEGGNAPVDRFLAWFDREGQLQGRVSLGDVASVERIATSPAGDVLVQGRLWGQLDIEGHSVEAVHSHISNDSFLARFSPGSQLEWLMSCLRDESGGDSESDCSPGDMAFSSSGDVVAMGVLTGRVDLAGTLVETARPASQMSSTYIAKVDEGGQPTLLAVVDRVTGRAIDVRAEPFEVALGGSVAADTETTGAYVGLLADGTELVAARGMSLPPYSAGETWDVAVGPAGEIAIVGIFHGDADFGDGPVRGETDPDDGFIAIYDREVVERATR